MQNQVIYELKNVSKAYPGVKVFEDFSFNLRAGEIHCICGENGAGKSTLIKMLSGAHAPDSGEIIFEGKNVGKLTPRVAMEMGVQTIYQEHNLYPYLTVQENLFSGNEILKNCRIDRSEMKRRTIEVLEMLSADIQPEDVVGRLGGGAQKMVEIARGMIQNAKVLILDEPTASFSQVEIDHLLACLKRLSKSGVSIVYISHHLEEVFEIADRVTVIRDGKWISTRARSEITEQSLISEMVGRDVSMFYNREDVPVGDVVFEAENISGNGVENCSFCVHAGEVLGIYGMVGSGRTELAEVLFGVKRAKSGRIKIRGQEVRLRTPRDAIRNGMCFITEDRQGTGLFLHHSLDRNIPSASYIVTRSHLAMPRDDTAMANEYIGSLGIVTPGAYQRAVNLSGGNQQKVVLAKWFATQGDIFIFDEPTRGVDIGAKEEIYKLMTEMLRQRKAVIMISSDMPELIAMSNRAVVMRGGKIAGEVGKADMTQETLLKYSIGGKA